jgi:hypothetical protein
MVGRTVCIPAISNFIKFIYLSIYDENSGLMIEKRTENINSSLKVFTGNKEL